MLRLFAAATLVVVVLAAVGLGGAEYYTSRPDFCGTCHVMGPYYQSWSRDTHGKKLGARCVDCHYAPGERHTIKAKFKGLSQLASYFSGRYGATRPRARVNDASCLTARCHGDGAYLAKLLPIGQPRVEKRIIGTQETEVTRTPTVTFVHEKHLGIEAKIEQNEAQLDELRHRLRAVVAPAVFQEIQAAGDAMGPIAQREKDLRDRLTGESLEPLLPDALELMRLEHRETRLQQLAGLNCAACHDYDPSGKHHFSRADLQTCYTCHFTNQVFNRDTGECLKCHEPPTRKILIHDQAANLVWRQQFPGTTAPSGPALMDHRDIVTRGVECASCHLDVIQGAATVTARECTNCHDQQNYLEGFESRDTAHVLEYHRVHVKAQRARCVDCHRSIQHKLIDPLHVGTSAGFLQPILNDCQHCHPNHHHEQVELLMGIAGASATRPMPNAMFGSRLNCTGCHTRPAVDLKGDELIKASEQTCIACHGSDYEQLFEQWQNEILTYLKEAEASLARVQARLDELQTGGLPIPSGIDELVTPARENILFVKAGNGIHNKSYSLELLDLSIRSLDEAMARLTRE
jgi:nitrate/TMAO reductase-like tetraheme cytochrome c subunit